VENLTILVGTDVGEQDVAVMRDAFPTLRFLFCPEAAEFVAAASEADIMFSKGLPAGAMRVATKLRWFQAGTAGINHLLDAGLSQRNVILTNASGAHGVPIAEMILSMMLAFATGLNQLIRAQSSAKDVRTQVHTTKFELEGQTLCVIGLGDIGGTLATKAADLGMRVIGIRRSLRPFPGVAASYTPDRLVEALGQADHVALCLPLTKETHGFIGEAQLHAIKPGAYIYNVGRGASIEPNALLSALREGRLAGAGLDVTAPEPLPPEHPLWSMPNVLLSQHTSGQSPYNARRITSIFLDNLGRYLRGEPLANVIDLERGY